jgi:hypothetical protein
MRLSEEIATRDLAGRAPWFDAQRETDGRKGGKHTPEKFDRYGNDYEPAVAAVKALLADGEWHDTEEVRSISAAHGIKGYTLVMDRAGAYFERGRAISAKAAAEREAL